MVEQLAVTTQLPMATSVETLGELTGSPHIGG